MSTVNVKKVPMLTKTNPKRTLVVIPGIKGRMGTEYAKAFRAKGYIVVGISSKPSKNKNIFTCDLLNQTSLPPELISTTRSRNISEIILVHCIGKFLFEDEPGEINLEIYNSNVTTFKNICKQLFENCNPNCRFTLVAFGSISDRFMVPWWRSYSYSKICLRKYMLSLVSARVRGVFINVSSTEKDEERPFADKTFWLKCSEVVKRSLPSILNKELNFQEIDIIKINPNYKPDYFRNYKKIKQVWEHDLYNR